MPQKLNLNVSEQNIILPDDSYADVLKTLHIEMFNTSFTVEMNKEYTFREVDHNSVIVFHVRASSDESLGELSINVNDLELNIKGSITCDLANAENTTQSLEGTITVEQYLTSSDLSDIKEHSYEEDQNTNDDDHDSTKKESVNKEKEDHVMFQSCASNKTAVNEQDYKILQLEMVEKMNMIVSENEKINEELEDKTNQLNIANDEKKKMENEMEDTLTKQNNLQKEFFDQKRHFEQILMDQSTDIDHLKEQLTKANEQPQIETKLPAVEDIKQENDKAIFNSELEKFKTKLLYSNIMNQIHIYVRKYSKTQLLKVNNTTSRTSISSIAKGNGYQEQEHNSNLKNYKMEEKTDKDNEIGNVVLVDKIEENFKFSANKLSFFFKQARKRQFVLDEWGIKSQNEEGMTNQTWGLEWKMVKQVVMSPLNTHGLYGTLIPVGKEEWYFTFVNDKEFRTDLIFDDAHVYKRFLSYIIKNE